MRILSGVKSSGRIHLGNYYGAIQQFVRLQAENECLFFIANLHALTTVKTGAQLASLTREAALTYLALGLDPTRSTLFRQSDVPEVTELYWVLGTAVPFANLERAHSFKDRVAKGQPVDFGVFAYPVLMAADILLYGAEQVPVGKDQIQHIEFARDWATKFNVLYVPGYDPQDPDGKKGHPAGILRLPTARVQEELATIPGVDGQKMSKSYANTIELFGDEKEIKKRIMGIKTDSSPVDAPKPTTDSALYSLLKVMTPAADFAALDASWRAGGRGYGDYKKVLLEVFHTTFGPARARYAELEKDPAEVERILKNGAERARAFAAPYVSAVRMAVGLY